MVGTLHSLKLLGSNYLFTQHQIHTHTNEILSYNAMETPKEISLYWCEQYVPQNHCKQAEFL